MSDRKSAIVLGGGIGGMTAASELVERGFSVTVYELRKIPGGKSRTLPVPNSGTDGRPDLLGEHGFRFFPGFYKHLPDTMKRIPFDNNRQGTFGNLVPTSRIMLAAPTPLAALAASTPKPSCWRAGARRTTSIRYPTATFIRRRRPSIWSDSTGA